MKNFEFELGTLGSVILIGFALIGIIQTAEFVYKALF